MSLGGIRLFTDRPLEARGEENSNSNSDRNLNHYVFREGKKNKQVYPYEIWVFTSEQINVLIF